MPNPTIVWDWVYATVGGRKKVSDVRKNYGRRRSCSAYSNVFDVCAIFFWQKVVGDFNTLPHGSSLLLQQFGCDSQSPSSLGERRIVMLEYLLEAEYAVDDRELDIESDENPVSELRDLIGDHFGTSELTRWSDESLSAIISDSGYSVKQAFGNVCLLLDRTNYLYS